MKSTAIERAPAFAPAASSAAPSRSGDGFATVLARCTDVGPSADRTEIAANAQGDASDDDVPMLDDADVVAEDSSETIDARSDDATLDDEQSRRESDATTPDQGATIEAQTATAVVPEVATMPPVVISAAREPIADAPVATEAPSEPVPITVADTSARGVAFSPPLRSGAIRRPTPADGMDARARASIASQDAVVTGVPMRTDGGVRVNLRAPVVATTPASLDTVTSFAKERVAEATTAVETVVPTDGARGTIVRETVARETVAVARETAAIETAPATPVAIDRRTTTSRTGRERRGPITLARTDATPSPRTIAEAPVRDTAGATSSGAPRTTATSTPTRDPDASTSGDATPAMAPEPAPGPTTEAPLPQDASADAIATTPSDPIVASAATTSDPLAPPMPTPPSDAPAPSRTAASPPTEAPVVLTRAEDLAHAIEKLKPIPRGGATLDVETPGMGQLRLHVRVEDGVVKVRIHAGSEAAASWLAQERDGLTAAARNAVGSALGIELDLRGGTNDASDRRPAREATPAPLPYAGTAPRSSSTSAAASAPAPTARARGLVDVLA